MSKQFVCTGHFALLAEGKRRKELYEAQHPETVLGANQHSVRFRQIGEPNSESAVRFTAATAKATKRSERSVQRDARRGEALGADAAFGGSAVR